MKLKDCLEIAHDCELKTIKEAIFNVELHSINLFTYENIREELHELYDDVYASHQKAIEYCEKLMEMYDKNIDIDDMMIAHLIEILKGRE